MLEGVLELDITKMPRSESRGVVLLGCTDHFNAIRTQPVHNSLSRSSDLESGTQLGDRALKGLSGLMSG